MNQRGPASILGALDAPIVRSDDPHVQLAIIGRYPAERDARPDEPAWVEVMIETGHSKADLTTITLPDVYVVMVENSAAGARLRPHGGIQRTNTRGKMAPFNSMFLGRDTLRFALPRGWKHSEHLVSFECFRAEWPGLTGRDVDAQTAQRVVMAGSRDPDWAKLYVGRSTPRRLLTLKEGRDAGEYGTPDLPWYEDLAGAVKRALLWGAVIAGGLYLATRDDGPDVIVQAPASPKK